MSENQGNYSSPVKAIWQGISDLFKTKERVGYLADEDRLEGKTVMITGANSGLGFATAVQVAERGAKLIMACRSGIPNKGEEVKKRSGSNQVEMYRVDLSDIDSILDLVDTLKNQGIILDLLICNAAMVPRRSRKTKQGLEEMFMVNYLAKFLLINLLLKEGLIRQVEDTNTASRIIIVSSESHRNPKAFEWEQFGQFQDYGMDKTVALYGYYKLLLTTFANELSRRLNPDGKLNIPVFVLCPGPVNSNIAKEAPKVFYPLLKIIFGIFFKAPDKAAEPVLYLSCSKEVAEKPIDYLFLMSRKDMDEKATNFENGKKLWRYSENLLKQLGVIGF